MAMTALDYAAREWYVHPRRPQDKGPIRVRSLFPAPITPVDS
jgi:hypothetical protein